MSSPISGPSSIVIQTPLPTVHPSSSRGIETTSAIDTPHRVSFRESLPEWIKYLLITIIVGIVLGAPAIFIAFTHRSEQYWPYHLTDQFDPVLGEFFRWSTLGASTASTFYGVLTLVHLASAMVTSRSHRDHHEGLSERAVDKMKRLVLIKKYIAFPVTMLSLWILLGILICGVNAKSNLIGSSRLTEFYFIRAAFALFIFTVLLFFEKLIVQKIAINYHYDYYADRIAQNQFMMAVLRRLRLKFPPHHPQQQQQRSPTSLTAKLVSGLSTEESADVALAIFNGLRSSNRDYLVVSNLEGILNKEDARRFFESLDEDDNGDLTLKEVIQGVQQVYHEHDLLATAMASNDDLINRVDTLGFVLVLVVTIALCLPIFDVDIATSVFALASTIMAAKLAFSDSIVAIFSSIIFIFVSHPFDVGDVISVDGTKYSVKSIGWWVSSFYGDGGKLVYISNRTLEGASIGNIRRSGPQTENIVMNLHMKTTKDQIQKLEDHLNEFLTQRPRDFIDTTRIDVVELVNEQNIKLKMGIRHRSNFQKSSFKHARHIMIMNCLQEGMRKFGIKYAEDD